MTRVYYKDAHGALVVFDCTRQNTYDGALRWKTDLDSKITLADEKPLPAVLVANKVPSVFYLKMTIIYSVKREISLNFLARTISFNEEKNFVNSYLRRSLVFYSGIVLLLS